METNPTPGQGLHSEDVEARREAARLMGKARTERKAAASRENGQRYGGNRVVTDEMRAKMREAQKVRREREKQERLEMQPESSIAAEEKRGRGRPKTRPEPDPNAPKRGRGRPKKQEVSGSLPMDGLD